MRNLRLSTVELRRSSQQIYQCFRGIVLCTRHFIEPDILRFFSPTKIFDGLSSHLPCNIVLNKEYLSFFLLQSSAFTVNLCSLIIYKNVIVRNPSILFTQVINKKYSFIPFFFCFEKLKPQCLKLFICQFSCSFFPNKLVTIIEETIKLTIILYYKTFNKRSLCQCFIIK